jgi:hypothetical protein
MPAAVPHLNRALRAVLSQTLAEGGIVLEVTIAASAVRGPFLLVEGAEDALDRFGALVAEHLHLLRLQERQPADTDGAGAAYYSFLPDPPPTFGA